MESPQWSDTLLLYDSHRSDKQSNNAGSLFCLLRTTMLQSGPQHVIKTHSCHRVFRPAVELLFQLFLCVCVWCLPPLAFSNYKSDISRHASGYQFGVCEWVGAQQALLMHSSPLGFSSLRAFCFRSALQLLLVAHCFRVNDIFICGAKPYGQPGFVMTEQQTEMHPH